MMRPLAKKNMSAPAFGGKAASLFGPIDAIASRDGRDRSYAQGRYQRIDIAALAETAFSHFFGQDDRC
jgi:hypothetical protein